MASRKSCTHMTWAEAKAKTNPGGGPAASKKKVSMAKNTPQFFKVIAKQAGATAGELKAQAKSAHKQNIKYEEKSAQLEAKRAEEKERKRLEQVVKPYEEALKRLQELKQAMKEQSVTQISASSTTTPDDIQTMIEGMEMQLNEIMALEAILDDEFVLTANVDAMRETLEAVQADESLLQDLLKYPPISFGIQLMVDDPTGVADLVAMVLLNMTLPPHYPLRGATPTIGIDYFMLVNKTAVCSADKPLESLGYLDETKLQAALEEECLSLLPDLVVYEVAVTWLSEQLFDYVVMYPHGIAVLK